MHAIFLSFLKKGIKVKGSHYKIYIVGSLPSVYCLLHHGHDFHES